MRLICIVVTKSISSLYSQQFMFGARARSSRDVQPFLFYRSDRKCVFVFGGSGQKFPHWTRLLEIEQVHRDALFIFHNNPLSLKNHCYDSCCTVTPSSPPFPSQLALVMPADTESLLSSILSTVLMVLRSQWDSLGAHYHHHHSK